MLINLNILNLDNNEKTKIKISNYNKIMDIYNQLNLNPLESELYRTDNLLDVNKQICEYDINDDDFIILLNNKKDKKKNDEINTEISGSLTNNILLPQNSLTSLNLDVPLQQQPQNDLFSFSFTTPMTETSNNSNFIDSIMTQMFSSPFSTSLPSNTLSNGLNDNLNDTARYRNELLLLNNYGFYNEQSNLNALIQANGNVAEAINILSNSV